MDGMLFCTFNNPFLHVLALLLRFAAHALLKFHHTATTKLPGLGRRPRIGAAELRDPRTAVPPLGATQHALLPQAPAGGEVAVLRLHARRCRRRISSQVDAGPGGDQQPQFHARGQGFRGAGTRAGRHLRAVPRLRTKPGAPRQPENGNGRARAAHARTPERERGRALQHRHPDAAHQRVPAGAPRGLRRGALRAAHRHGRACRIDYQFLRRLKAPPLPQKSALHPRDAHGVLKLQPATPRPSPAADSLSQRSSQLRQKTNTMLPRVRRAAPGLHRVPAALHDLPQHGVRPRGQVRVPVRALPGSLCGAVQGLPLLAAALALAHGAEALGARHGRVPRRQPGSIRGALRDRDAHSGRQHRRGVHQQPRVAQQLQHRVRVPQVHRRKQRGASADPAGAARGADRPLPGVPAGRLGRPVQHPLVRQLRAEAGGRLPADGAGAALADRGVLGLAAGHLLVARGGAPHRRRAAGLRRREAEALHGRQARAADEPEPREFQGQGGLVRQPGVQGSRQLLEGAEAEHGQDRQVDSLPGRGEGAGAGERQQVQHVLQHPGDRGPAETRGADRAVQEQQV